MALSDRARAGFVALIAGAFLLVSAPAKAMRVEFRFDSVATIDGSSFGGTGFDNSTLMLEPTMDITNEWQSAGVPMPGEMFALELSEVQTLTDSDGTTGLPGQELNVTATWTSLVEWTVTNTTGLDGPALLFFSGLQEFPDPQDPSTAAPEQYLPSEVGILMNEDLQVVRYEAQSGTFYYLAFLIEDFSQPVQLSFEYEVTRDIIGFETDDFGTPILQMNAFFLPEPSASLLTVAGLLGLAYIGRSRGH
jgi:hypothetical protein